MDVWVPIGIFVATQVLTLVWVVATTKADARSIRAELTPRLDAMQTELRSLGNVLVTLANFQGDVRLLNERISTMRKEINDLRRGKGLIREDFDQKEKD